VGASERGKFGKRGWPTEGGRKKRIRPDQPNKHSPLWRKQDGEKKKNGCERQGKKRAPAGGCTKHHWKRGQATDTHLPKTGGGSMVAEKRHEKDREGANQRTQNLAWGHPQIGKGEGG